MVVVGLTVLDIVVTKVGCWKLDISRATKLSGCNSISAGMVAVGGGDEAFGKK